MALGIDSYCFYHLITVNIRFREHCDDGIVVSHCDSTSGKAQNVGYIELSENMLSENLILILGFFSTVPFSIRRSRVAS